MGIINGKYIKENNYNILNEKVSPWTGEFPFKQGDNFPPQSHKDRADTALTNMKLFENSIDEVYNSILSVIPETDIINGWQIREIVGRLPYFKNSVDAWVNLICGKMPFITVAGKRLDIGQTNIEQFIKDDVTSRFLQTTTAYRVVRNELKRTVKLVPVPVKNTMYFVDEEDNSEIKVVIIFSIYKNDKGSSICEFVEYHEDGLQIKRVFNYNSGKLGREIKDAYKEENSGFGSMPIVIMRHNCYNSLDIYGVDQFRYWDASICGAMRALQNVFRAGERCRELIRKVPSSATNKDNATGMTRFVNRGVVEYNENAEKYPEISYEHPDYGMMTAAIAEFDEAMKSVSIDTGLGNVFWNIEKAGSNLSAKAIEAMMYPTKLRLLGIQNEMNSGLIDAVVLLNKAVGIDVDRTDVDIMWQDSMPRDYKEFTDAIMSRLTSKVPTITPERAIMLLDGIDIENARAEYNRIAKWANEHIRIDDKAEENSTENNTSENNDEGEDIKIDLIAPSGSAEGGNDGAVEYNNGDNVDDPNAPMWEYQVPFPN